MAPLVWLLSGAKAGDNSQVLALGEALGWPYELKRFTYRRYELLGNLLGPSLFGIVPAESSPLRPPWPDLVVSSGRRNEPVCRWVQSQAARAGKRVRLVHIGRPLARIERFDLIITTPQYRVKPHPSVLQNETPLQRVRPGRLREAAALWGPRFAALPAPRLAVMVGGNSGPYTLDRVVTGRLARDVNALAKGLGASLLVTTSARTPPLAARALRAALTVPSFFYEWSSSGDENPYFGILALADRLVVTGDSISMLTEACATGKPVYIFDPAKGHGSIRPQAAEPRAAGSSLRGYAWDWDHPRALIYRMAMRAGLRRLTRDVGLVHQILIDSGHAVWLGEEFPAVTTPPPLQDIDRAVACVRGLFAG